MEPDMMVWLDLETTGLRTSADFIVELGIVITDIEGRRLAHFSTLVHEESPAWLWKNMLPEVREMHAKSGLLGALESAPAEGRMITSVAEEKAIEFLEANGVVKGTMPMCGSSVHFDRGFLAQWMDELHDYFHYRNIDVSTLKTLCGMLNSEVAERAPEGKKAHRALSDLDDTIQLYRFYMDNFLHVTI